MKKSLPRRDFLKATAAVAAVVHVAQAQPAAPQRVVVGILGGGRGMQLGAGCANVPGLTVKYACDVDEKRAIALAKSIGDKAAAAKKSDAPPQIEKDFRKILDDKEVDAILVATPDHWHAPATIMGCAAGKHVYCEKPGSHNPAEGEMMIAAARKHNRCVQLGNQRRSWPKVVEAIEMVKSGRIGPVKFARCWYATARKGIGHGKPAAVPPELDWSLWQGPAPEQEYRDNVVPYNWHWFWHWGTGECGNNGVHSVDLARWALGVDCPKRVTAGGGRYHFEDDWQCPDTMLMTCDFGDKMISWEGRSCHPRGPEHNSGFGVAFYGEQGTLVLEHTSYTLYDPKNKEVAKEKIIGGDHVHLINFAEAIRTKDSSKLNSEIATGFASTLLCHLGNIAWRTGRTLNIDPKSRRIVGDADAMKLWSREYRKGWEPKV